MSFNPQEFITNLVGTGARPNLFQIQLAFPAITGAGAARRISLVAKAGSLPGADLGTIRMNYQGREIKYPGDRSFSDWTCQIINDETFDVRDSFISWQNKLNSLTRNIRDAAAFSPSTYAVEVLINQYSKLNDQIPIKTIALQGAYPSNIGPIELNWDTKDSIEEFSVTFQYQAWTDAGNIVSELL
jgi:Straboviridae tail tube protein Gp19